MPVRCIALWRSVLLVCKTGRRYAFAKRELYEMLFLKLLKCKIMNCCLACQSSVAFNVSVKDLQNVIFKYAYSPPMSPSMNIHYRIASKANLTNSFNDFSGYERSSVYEY